MNSIFRDNIMWCVLLNTSLNHLLIQVRNLTVELVSHQVTEVGIKERVNLVSQCILSTKKSTFVTESREKQSGITFTAKFQTSKTFK